MKLILKIISFFGLVLTIVPAMLVFKGIIDIKVHYHLMVAGMILWFGTAPFWMKSKSLDEQER
jgi:hypothetical protein